MSKTRKTRKPKQPNRTEQVDANPSIRNQPQNEADRQVATTLWNIVGGFNFFVALGLVLGISGEKIGPADKFAGFSRQALPLIGIPLLAATLLAASYFAIKYANAARDSDWTQRVPPIAKDLSKSTLRRAVAIVILIGFLFFPAVALVDAHITFFKGSYYFARNASAGCDESDMTKDCSWEGTGWSHFWPTKHGLSVHAIFNTPYRYEGNKTYLPLAFPMLFLLMSLLAIGAFLKYVVILVGFHPARR